MSGEGDDGLFEERERFGLTALEALSARRLLSCCQNEDEDKTLDSLVYGQGDDGFFQERERFWSDCT